jgi:hypothetical protein
MEKVTIPWAKQDRTAVAADMVKTYDNLAGRRHVWENAQASFGKVVFPYLDKTVSKAVHEIGHWRREDAVEAIKQGAGSASLHTGFDDLKDGSISLDEFRERQVAIVHASIEKIRERARKVEDLTARIPGRLEGKEYDTVATLILDEIRLIAFDYVTLSQANFSYFVVDQILRINNGTSTTTTDFREIMKDLRRTDDKRERIEAALEYSVDASGHRKTALAYELLQNLHLLYGP